MSWANRRQLIYLLSFFVLVFLAVFGVYRVFFQKAPSCFDNVKDGNETGVDCGGSCTLLCSDESLAPIIEWSRAFPISSSTYSLVAYVQNPNLAAGTSYTPYEFDVYDANNNEIFKDSKATIIPPGKVFAVFDGPVTIASGTPARVDFSFGNLVWSKMSRDNDLSLQVNQIRLAQDVPTPVVDATIVNQSLQTVSNIEAVALVYDDSGNVIGVDDTLVDSIAGEGSHNISYTWQQPFEREYTQCTTPSNVALVVDRSGSMASDAANPPEPLTSVKNAAESFVNNMGKDMNVSLVSFATTASDPPDQPLTNSISALDGAISGITIHTDGAQETDIADALGAGGQTLFMSSSTAKNVLVLLTDGVPDLPQSKTDSDYPSNQAITESNDLKSKGVEIYTIGLGNNVNTSLLQRIASAPDHYFAAPDATELQSIYSGIGTTLCTKNPVIEIITRIFPGAQ